MFLVPARRFFGNASSPKMPAGADNPFRIRTYEKAARKSFAIRTYKNPGLKPPGINTYKKPPGGGGSPLFPFTFFLLPFASCFLASVLPCSPASPSRPWRMKSPPRRAIPAGSTCCVGLCITCAVPSPPAWAMQLSSASSKLIATPSAPRVEPMTEHPATPGWKRPVSLTRSASHGVRVATRPCAFLLRLLAGSKMYARGFRIRWHGAAAVRSPSSAHRLQPS